MAKHRSAVSVFCRVQNVGSACNAGGSSSLLTRMNAAARLMQGCASTDLKTSQHLLQHASNTPCTQAAAQQEQRTAQHARRCIRTLTKLLTRPRVTRSITNSAQLQVASRWHANATHRNMRRTRPHGEQEAKMEPSGGSACCRGGDARILMNSSGRLIGARSCAGGCSLPSTTRASDKRLPVR
jgi:hypothetical protein